MRNLLDILQGNARGIAFWSGGEDDTLVSLGCLCGDGDGCSLGKKGLVLRERERERKSIL